MNILVILQVQQAVKMTAAEEFFQHDPTGIGMTIIASSIVFSALLLLYLVFKNLAYLFTKDFRRRSLLKEGKVEEAQKMEEQSSGELNAAIATALYFYSTKMHDYESMKITINRVSRNYSPWSSKIYSLRQWPVVTKNK
jgi:Na+-transporting methylmalonyl-CoA/oxaloacetate decarboxylase gamma subunit